MVATIRNRLPVPVFSMTAPETESLSAPDEPAPEATGSKLGDAVGAGARRGAGRASWEPSFT